MRVLLVKMSSLGDVAHGLIGVTDAARARPDVVFDWVAEEAYAEIPRWHPAVRRVIPCALRRWRGSLVSTALNGAWGRFLEDLRSAEYDLVLDAQGLMKSGFVARQARGRVAGRSARSARERAAALFYQQTHTVDLRLTEVEQLRQLFALALNYPMPAVPADFGIDLGRLPATPSEGPYVMLLHGAAWKAKLWPEENWIGLASEARRNGWSARLPWGSAEELARANRIAAASGAEVLPKMSLGDTAARLRGARWVAGLDTGLTHIAVALGVRTVTLYGPSIPVYETVAGGELVNLCSSDSRKVDTRRPNTVPLAHVLDAVAAWRS